MSKNIKSISEGMKKGAGMKKDNPVQLKPAVVPGPTAPKKK
ncbi:MAG: hypothetical protein ABSB95_12795 [Dissulfurispiraceae bacterium]|jgi:hypothetical protein